MADHAAFLKGINLGRRRITNEELARNFTAIGLLEVATFRAAGNVIFSAPQATAERELVELIERRLEAVLGYPVAAFLRSGTELRAIAALAPFEADTRARLQGKAQVALLSRAPAKSARAQALALSGEDDALALGPRELHWLPAGPISRSALDLKALERLLGPMTIRTMGTIELIASRHFAS
jgi:uncharacterized protein (DUF1697 family)